jgi:malonyl-CoA decarboxylase
VNEKNKKLLPVNDVCRFHLGNGAIIDDIVVNAIFQKLDLKDHLV